MNNDRSLDHFGGRIALFGIWIFGLSICFAGCVSQPSKNYETTTVLTYAELTLLFEQEKMKGQLPDSTYKSKVDSFFASKGTDRGRFKSTIEQISQDPAVWKLFITDVSAAMDTMRR